MKTYKIGIICGNIAKKMALTLGGMKHVECYAVLPSKEKAEAFSGEWQFTKAYGSSGTDQGSPCRPYLYSDTAL